MVHNKLADVTYNKIETKKLSLGWSTQNMNSMTNFDDQTFRPIKEDQPTNMPNKYNIQVLLPIIFHLMFNIFWSSNVLIFNWKNNKVS